MKQILFYIFLLLAISLNAQCLNDYTATAQDSSKYLGIFSSVYWQNEYGTKKISNDLSGQGKNFSILGWADSAAVMAAMDGTANPIYETGDTLYFDGSSYFARAHDAKFDIRSGDIVSFSCWFKTRDVTPAAAMVLFGKWQDTNNRWIVYINTTGTLQIFGRVTAGNRIVATTSAAAPFTNNTWHHVAVVWKQGTGTARFYVDAVKIASTTSQNTAATLANADSIYIGCQGELNFFEGSIAQVHFMRGDTLTAAEIYTEYDTSIDQCADEQDQTGFSRWKGWSGKWKGWK